MSICLKDLPIIDYSKAMKSKYSVKPDLQKLGHDFGNGNADGKIFQIDSNFLSYRAEKIKAREEFLSRYYQNNLPPESTSILAKYIISSLIEEYPNFFEVRKDGNETYFRNKITGEEFLFDEKFNIIRSVNVPFKRYASSLDALACQVQEDLAVMQTDQGSNKLSAGHICFPSSWALEDKIGKDFAQIHSPVPGISLSYSHALVESISNKGPFVRFVFGFSNDDSLNHHSSKMPPDSQLCFNTKNPKLFLRIERQTTSPIQELNSSLFTIKL